MLFGLLLRRSVPLPTWRGWLVLLGVGVLAITFVGRQACAFLTVNDPAPGGALVIEGWLPGYAARTAIEEFRREHYDGLFVTGGPIEPESPLAHFGSYAALMGSRLQRMGIAEVHLAPALEVRKDRTYSMALALRDAMRAEGVPMAKINLISVGPHSRRSRLIYQMAFGPETHVGTIAIEDREFDPARWWTSSQGVRTVIDEVIAYCYARFIFSPPVEG